MLYSNQALLLNLDKLLSNFLKAYAAKRLNRFEAIYQVNRLREITFGEKKQFQYLDNRFKALENWFIETGPRLSKKAFNRELSSQVSKCIDRICVYCTGDIDNNSKAANLFNRKLAAKVASMANVFYKESCRYSGYQYSPVKLKLARPPETVDYKNKETSSKKNDLKEKFKNSLDYQVELIEYFQDTDEHLFTIVDNLLKNIERKPDIKTSHLAASILYFMKANNYKVAPYVERLRKLNRQHDER